MDTEKIPTAILAICREINEQWLVNSGSVTPYLMDEREWRLSLQSERGIVVRSLNPDAADGHTYLIMSRSLDGAFNDGRIEGLKVASERLFAKITEVVHGV